MSDSQIKPIIISPELFNLTPKNSRNKTLKKKVHITRNMQPNKLKSDLLSKIKNYKYNKQINNNDNNNDNDTTNDNHNANHNANITVNKMQIKPTIKSPNKSVSLDTSITEPIDEFTASINFLKELSSKKKTKRITNDPSLPVSLNTNFEDIYSSKNTISSDLGEQPKYGCLKNSILPTYREWKRNTLKKPNVENVETVENVKNVETVENVKNVETVENVENVKNVKNNKTNGFKTTTYKYYLGKRGKKISVLVKNNETRKKISGEHNLIKQTNVHDMKNYLKRHNLLKSGSHAPSDVIKKMYEQALLSGDIRNSNKDSLIHNFLSES